jgi:hypothetical protein
MAPMPPMSYAMVGLGHSSAQGVGGGAPGTDSLLTRQHETRRARPGEIAETGGYVLASTALRINDALDGFSKVRGLDRRLLMVAIPGAEQPRRGTAPQPAGDAGPAL